MNTPLAFNFYRRYKWRAQDFENFQKLVTDLLGGTLEGLVGRAVFQGLEYEGSTGLNLTVGPGFGASASGYLMGQGGTNVVAIPAAPTGAGQGARHLVVLRPLVTDQNTITLPTSPGINVPLNEEWGSEVVVIPGTASTTPDYNYAASGANDVVLFGVRQAQNQATFSSTDIDLRIRDVLGKNSALARTMAHFDDRLRPYRVTISGTLGIKPAQSAAPSPRNFVYSGGAKPSIFPKQSGSYVEQDTFLNFKTGAISGGDTTSSAFTPTIPSAGNSIVALVTLGTNDQLSVAYGTAGTYAQCRAAIISQTTAGAGGVPTSTNYKIAFVIVTSSDGVNVTEMDVIDARGIGSNFTPSGAKSVRRVTASDTILSTDQVIEADASSNDVTLTLPPRSANQGNEYFVDRVDDGTAGHNVTVIRAGSDTFEGAATGYLMDQGFQSQSYFAGTTFWKVRG